MVQPFLTEYLYPFTFEILDPPETLVWIYDTFANNLEIKNDFSKNLKVGCF